MSGSLGPQERMDQVLATPSGVVSAPAPDIGNDRRTTRMFQDQIRAAGAVWILFGALAVAANTLVPMNTRDGRSPMALIVIGIGVLWMVAGIATYLRQMRAVYAGLVVSYVALVLHVVNANLIWLLFDTAIILQAHRVLGFAKKLMAAGVPLTAKP